MRTTNLLVALYLAAIVLANVLVSRFGAPAAVVNAFLFIGLDLSTRDCLHAQWHGRGLWPRMLLLISTGGLLSLLLGGAARIALASCLAFILAGIADTVTYHTLRRQPWLWRVHGSNLAGATVDSLCFPILAFGWPLLWGVVLGQLIAKIAGSTLWAAILHRKARVFGPMNRDTHIPPGS